MHGGVRIGNVGVGLEYLSNGGREYSLGFGLTPFLEAPPIQIAP